MAKKKGKGKGGKAAGALSKPPRKTGAAKPMGGAYSSTQVAGTGPGYSQAP